MKTLQKSLVIVTVVALLVLPTLQTAYGGSGTYNPGTPDKLTLNVIFQYNEATFNPNPTWEAAFTRASKLLYNSTDGQVQIGTVNFINHCPGANSSADVQIQPGSGGASAHRPGLGTSGRSIFVYEDTHSLDQPTARGHFGIVHEIGHYVFALYDEYKDQFGTSTSCISPSSTVASIMDGGTTVQPNNQRTEWSIAAYATACQNTAQYQITGMTSWPWIAQYVNANYGTTLTIPTTYDISLPPGHQALNFNYRVCMVRSVVCLDRSGSMAGTKIATAQAGAKIFVDLNNQDDELGVSSYAATPSSDYAIALMTAVNKTAAKAAIDGLSADGYTNIGGGLQTSLDMITAQGDPVACEAIVLLSDGIHNTGTNPSTVIPALIARGVNVHTIGVGGDVNGAFLSNLASQTGGAYHFAPSTVGLAAHFNTAFALSCGGGGLINVVSEQIPADYEVLHTVDVDSYTAAGGEVTFILSWESGGDLDLYLRRPDKTTVTVYPYYDKDVVDHVKDDQSEMYRMRNPAVGGWMMIVRSNSGVPVSYDLQVNSSAASNVMVQTTTNEAFYSTSEPILVQTSVQAPKSIVTNGVTNSVTPTELYGERVVGADVNAEVLINEKVVGEITLYDDGLKSHGDAMPNDGVYSNYFGKTSAVGNYAFNVTVDNANGETAPPDEEFPGWVPSPVDPFTRKSLVTVFVSELMYQYLPNIFNKY